MKLFQIKWLKEGLTGFQQNTILRSFLYNLNGPEHHHLFNHVDAGSNVSYVSIDYDLSLVSSLLMRFNLMDDKLAEPVTKFTVVGDHKNRSLIEDIYSEKEVSASSLTMKEIKDSPFCRMYCNFHRSFKNTLIEVDVRKVSSIKQLGDKSVSLFVEPTVSIGTLIKKLKIRNGSVGV